MNYLKNKLLLLILGAFNTFGRALVLKKKILSDKLILEKNYPKNKDFKFIQVGANDGISFDFLYEFVTSRNSTGLVIEPINSYFKELVINYQDYREIIKVKKAIHLHKKSIKILKIKPSQQHKYPEWVKGIASFDKNHFKKSKISKEDMVEEIVLADTFMNVVYEFYPDENIDYIQIDTEGYDFEILKMINYEIIHPAIIKFEFINLNKEDRVRSIDLLKKKGYFLFNERYDTVAIDLHRIKLL